MGAAMAPGELRARFDQAIAGAATLREVSRAARARHRELLGWLPPAEIDDYAAGLAGYRECVDHIDDRWMIGPVFGEATELPGEIAEVWDGFAGAMWLLCGVVEIGSDPSGDTAWCSTLPSPSGAAVYRHDHEIGVLDRELGGSLAGFIGATWGEQHDARRARRSEPWRDPLALFSRSRWLLSFGAGHTAFGFAGDLCKAAPLDAWRDERDHLAGAPWLANYWLLAHFYLGNRRAAADAVDRAADSPAELTRQLAWAVDRALADESAGLLSVPAVQVAELQAACAKNALPELLESAGAAKSDGPDPAEVTRALEAGDDPWSWISRYPDDVAVHDAALEHLATTDEALGDLIGQYFRQRTREYYNEWPYDHRMASFDRRLAPAIAAAFRAGLAFDADHGRAFAGITHALGKLDDDHTIAAYRQAIETLALDDDRLEVVIAHLARSRHPEAATLIRRAAWRCFELLEQARANDERLASERERDGLTLDTMFGTDNHLLVAMRLVLEAGGEEAARLADRILVERQHIPQLGRRFGDALRVAGDRQMAQHAELAFELIDAVAAIAPRNTDDFLEETELMNFGEACIAAAKLDGDRAAETLRPLFDRETRSRLFDLDVKAATLGALLLCEGASDELVGWTERILGNRTNNARLAPALRAAGEAGLEAARDWVRYHVYSSKNDFMAKDAVIARNAQWAAAALGDGELPPFDDTDEFALGVEPGDLWAALDRPDRYRAGSVCERIVEHRVRSPETVARLSRFAADQLRYSADEHDRESGDASEVVKALASQGEPALPELARLLELPHLAPGWATPILLAMRFAVPEARSWVAAARMSTDEALAALETPPPRWMASLDLVAGRARAGAGDRATPAIEQAARWRLRRTGSVFDDRDPAIFHLKMMSSEVAAAPELAEPAVPVTLTSRAGEHGWAATIEITPEAVRTRVQELYCNVVGDESLAGEVGIEDAGMAEMIARMAAAIGYR